MDYNVVKNSVDKAYVNYKTNNGRFYSNMNDFFKEGKKNPSVAKILLQDCVTKHQKQAMKMLAEVASIPGPNFFEPMISNARVNLYNISLFAVMKSLDANELYKKSEYNESDSMNIDSQYKKEFESEWERLYPKTGKLRDRIIEAKRISMDKVTLKPNWYEKINFMKTVCEYAKDYPKTILTRYKLVMDNQIREEEVTPNVKGWFKRFTYKKLIRGNFKFKK